MEKEGRRTCPLSHVFPYTFFSANLLKRLGLCIRGTRNQSFPVFSQTVELTSKVMEVFLFESLLNSGLKLLKRFPWQ